MKYNTSLSEAQKLLPNAKKVAVVLPMNSSVDYLAAGLALFLSLKQAGKESFIATKSQILVGHSNLFGVGEIKDKLPQTSGGNLTLVLGDVVTPDGSVPALEKLTWEPKGSDLQLIFEVVPGQKFEPTSITPSYSGSGLDLVFVLGALTLSELGDIYTNSLQAFTSTHVVNIDNKPSNALYGNSNAIDPASSSLSEMVSQIILGLQLPMDQDMASNVLFGIYSQTNNLQGGNVSPDTFMMVAEALKAGGKSPLTSTPVQPTTTVAPELVTQPTPSQPQEFDLSKVFKMDSFTMPQVVSDEQPQQARQVSSQEERPMGEIAITTSEEVVSPEPDWLTPKIYKGGSVG